MSTRPAPRGTLAVITGLTLTLAGCTGEGTPAAADRAGNAGPTVLRLATMDSISTGGESEFINAVEEVSGGRLTLDVVTEYGDAAPEAESNLIKAVVDGSLDLGIAATRAYARAGITGLQAVEAPLLLDSDDAVLEVVEGSAGEQILSGLEDDGLKGLALLHGGLRRPFSTEAPLRSPEDWPGKRFRVYNSPVQAAAVQALGATPVNESYQWGDKIRAGELDGGEFSIQGMADFDIGTGLGFVTPNLVLWPKVETIIIQRDRWDALTEEERGWLTEAAERAVSATVSADRDESLAAEQVCGDGMRLVPTDETQLAAYEEALAPVRDSLADDPAEAPLLTALEEIAARHETPSVPTVPTACQDPGDGPAEEPAAAPQKPVPDGTYRMTVSQDELTAAEINNGPGWSGTWTLTVTDGVYALTCTPVDLPGKDCGNFTGPADTVLESGPVVPVPGGVQLAYDLDPEQDLTCEGCARSDGYQVTWALEGDQLTLTHLEGQPGGEFYQWTFNPWTRIG